MRTFLKLAGILLALALAIAGCSSPTGGGGGGPSGSPETYAVTVDSTITGGSVTVSPTSGTAGTTITITVTPDNNKALKAGSPRAATTADDTTIMVTPVSAVEFTFTLPAAAVTVTAEFGDVPPGNHLIGIPAFSNGSVTSSPATSAAANASVTLTIVPAEGYQLKTIGVTKTEDLITPVTLSGSGDTRTFTMPAYDVTVSAEFEPKSYTIAKDTMTNGDVTVVTSAPYGSTVTLTAVPESNYRLKAGTLTVYKDGTPATTVSLTGSGNTWSFEMPAYNVRVSAEFEAIPPGGELLTLNNIPLAVTGQVAVLLAPVDDPDNPTVVGLGTVSGQSVTVNLHDYTGDENDPEGAPWTKDAGTYWVLIAYGPDYDYICISPSAMTIPGNNIINASGFHVDGPSGPPVGHITGTLSISGFPEDVRKIYISAYQPLTVWHSREATWASNITDSSLSKAFDIPLYGPGDEQGTFGAGNVEIQVVVRFTDETTWYLHFDNSPPSGNGWNINHNGDNPIGLLSDSIPSTKLISGSLGGGGGVTLPSGKQLDHVRVELHCLVTGVVPGADLNMEDWVSWPWSWTIRVADEAKVGMWQVYAASKTGDEYSKTLGYWTGQPLTGNNLGSIAFTSGDTGNDPPLFFIDPVYQGTTYTGFIDSTSINLTVDEYHLSWSGGASGSLPPYVFTVPGGNITGGGTWAYVYQNNDKVGFIVSTTSGKNIYLGDKATTVAAIGHGISTIVLTGIPVAVPDIQASAGP